MKTLVLITLSFAAVGYAAEVSNTPAVVANLAAGAEAARAAFATDRVQAKGDAQVAKSAKRAAYAQAVAAEQAFRREQFAQLARTTDPKERAALIAAIEGRWNAHRAEIARLKAEAEAEEPGMRWS